MLAEFGIATQAPTPISACDKALVNLGTQAEFLKSTFYIAEFASLDVARAFVEYAIRMLLITCRIWLLILR
jgi:hypothetical protein